MTTWTVPATVVRVVDADTIVVNLDLGWRVYRNGEHLRIAGVDAPERGTDAGKAATAWARSILLPGDVVEVRSTGKPSFERTVGSIIVHLESGDVDYAELLVAAGHAQRARA